MHLHVAETPCKTHLELQMPCIEAEVRQSQLHSECMLGLQSKLTELRIGGTCSSRLAREAERVFRILLKRAFLECELLCPHPGLIQRWPVDSPDHRRSGRPSCQRNECSCLASFTADVAQKHRSNRIRSEISISWGRRLQMIWLLLECLLVVMRLQVMHRSRMVR